MEEKYPSGQILLEISKSEYENEKNRTSIIDSKTNITITLLSVLFVAITQILNLKKIFEFEIKNFADAVLPAVLFVTIMGSIIIALISLICFLKVIFTKTYFTVDSQYFYDVEKLKYEPTMYAIAVSQFYIEATNTNKAANDKRIREYKCGMILLIVSIVLYAVYAVVTSAI